MTDQITEDYLKEALVARLGATHVEIEDISGTYPTFCTPRYPGYIGSGEDPQCPALSTPILLSPISPVLSHISPTPPVFPCLPPTHLSSAPTQPSRSPPTGPGTASPQPDATNKIQGGCGQAFKAKIVSPQFAGLNSLKRHRLVNAALKDEIGRIHAWSAKCLTPEEAAR